MSSPGTMPPMKSLPIDTLPRKPYRMRPIDGGIVAVISAPTAMTAHGEAAREALLEHRGPRMRASIAASATAEPDTPPISADTTIATCARPPVIQPVITLASEMMRSVMPETFIRLPASTNSGTASSGNDCVADAIRCTPICAGIVSEARKNTRLATPTANATGMPRNISARNRPVSATVTAGSPRPRT